MGRRPSLIHVVEACYQVETPEAEWLGALADAAGPFLADGLGTAAFVYERTAEGKLAVGGLQLSPRVDPTWLRGFLAGIPVDFVGAWRQRTSGYVADDASFAGVRPALAAFGGATDVFSILGAEPSGHGVWLGAPTRKRRRLSADRLDAYARLSAHLAAALRIRRALGGRAVTSTAEAILRPDGGVEHADGHAKTREARDELRRAALRMEEARTARGRRDAESSLRRWRALVEARWSLVDHFDHDGRRFVVATCNEPATPNVVPLSQRERQVLSFAALGHHDKLIAYELGLSGATVRVLLHRAAMKLGVRGRSAALAAYLRAAPRDAG